MNAKNKNSTYQVKNIPLKVKPIKSPAKKKMQKENTNSTTKVDANKNLATILPSSKKILSTSNIIGNWQTKNNGLFVFQDDNTFYWYDSYKHLEDNYYKGTYTYKKGIEALEDMGYTQEEFYLIFQENVSLDNVYSMNIQPQILYKAGQDMRKELGKNESWWFILIIKNDNTAQGYNKTLDNRYNLIRN